MAKLLVECYIKLQLRCRKIMMINDFQFVYLEAY